MKGIGMFPLACAITNVNLEKACVIVVIGLEEVYAT
jgi:hypothetical protein